MHTRNVLICYGNRRLMDLKKLYAKSVYALWQIPLLLGKDRK